MPPREHGRDCDIKDLSRGSKVCFPVYVKGGGLGAGLDLSPVRGQLFAGSCAGMPAHGRTMRVDESDRMPVYDYECDRCGPFTAMRPMAECDLALACPACDAEAPRAFLTAPNLGSMSAQKREAHARNERSADSPRTFSGMKRQHGSGCGCCSSAPSPAATRAPDGAKSLPSKRPWTISH